MTATGIDPVRPDDYTEMRWIAVERKGTNELAHDATISNDGVLLKCLDIAAATTLRSRSYDAQGSDITPERIVEYAAAFYAFVTKHRK